MREQSRATTTTIPIQRIRRSFLRALCIGSFFASTTASATVMERSIEEKPAFEREWAAVATGVLAVGNLLVVLDHRFNPFLALAGIGSGAMLASTDDGKLSYPLAAVGFVLGVSQAFGMEQDRTKTASRLNLIGVPTWSDGRLSPSLVLRYQF